MKLNVESKNGTEQIGTKMSQKGQTNVIFRRSIVEKTNESYFSEMKPLY